MRLYAGSSQQFIQDTVTNQIAEKLKSSFFTQYRYEPSPAEIRSWRNSLRAMCHTIEHASLLDHGIILEYQLPLSSNRLDCMVCGHDSDEQPNAVIVELKQWDGCSDTEGKNEVLTWLGGAQREVLHPSVQVGQYKMYLEDMHPAFYEPPDAIKLNACSYLHNYHHESDDAIYDCKFSEALKHCPTFSADHYDNLASFLKAHLEAGDGYGIMKRAEENRYRPSKKLMQHVGNVIKGKHEYILLDEQLVVYDKVLSIAKKGFHDRKKAVLIVKGGPGTGKSVIAINLMADLLLNDYNAHYATGSRAFTTTLREAIGRRGAPQFKYFNSFEGAENNLIDVLICDESHRIRDYSWSRFTPREQRSNVHQIEELINVAKVSVFFIDDKQVVRPNEVGSVSLIKESAKVRNYETHEYELDVQFRCAGSEAFVAWVNNTLGIERTANVLWNQEENFDFRIFSDPFSIEDAIRQKVDEGHTGRMTAGFCWPWSKELKPDRSLYDDVVIGEYRRPWNARPEATRLPRNIPKANLWAYDSNGINQIGCIYTAQGFEFDYVGVIFGEDLVYDLDAQKWIGKRENSSDTVVRRAGDQFLELTKNTYRVLLSRGMKGCYVYFMDKDTERFIKSRIEHSVTEEAKNETLAEDISKTYLPFRYLPLEKVRPFENCVPLYDLKAAASVFSDEQQVEDFEWVKLPEAFRPQKNLFVAQVIGESMNRRIPNGAWCLFKLFPVGTRHGKVVLVQHREIQDSDIGGHFTIKIYESQKKFENDGSWRHSKIILRPDSTYPEYEPIILSADQAEDLRVLAELVAVLS
jgi:uncharacterized protein